MAGNDVDTSRAAQRGVHDGLERFAEDVLALARSQVPIGDPLVDPNPAISLAASGRLVWRNRGTVEVRFETEYATKVHESVYLEHPRGGTHHYLENALKALAPRLEEYIADAVEAELHGISGARGRTPRAFPETFGRTVYTP
jgi:hypothetical protein